MKFLEAKSILSGFRDGLPLSFTFATSGSAEPFDIYLRAHGAKSGRRVETSLLPFGTFSQFLRTPFDAANKEVILLMPWDLAPETDWRTGIPESADEDAMRGAAGTTAELIARRGEAGARLLYLPAPLPPMFVDRSREVAFGRFLESIAHRLRADVLPAEAFSISSYLASGCPVSGHWVSEVASRVIDAALETRREPKKVLVTDLDNVLWAGGIAEDGLEGVAFTPHGKGYRHFLYQTLLKRLRLDGTILAAVSRNDQDVVSAPFRSKRMALQEADFVAIVASYHAKSAQIRELATRLNLGLDSFVFVDDNPVELAEVSLSLPDVTCRAFPSRDDDLPEFLIELASLFHRSKVTAEDRERTEMYRRMADGLAPSDVEGADLDTFLESLSMTLTLHARTEGDRTRAEQLINKTNQFNLNGRRVSASEVSSILENGGRLYGASLTDRSGSHGEILACLVNRDGIVVSFVMSCRVFQRRVEHAFTAWLMGQPNPPIGMDWQRTPRNEPFVGYLRHVAGQDPSDGIVALDPSHVYSLCEPALRLMTVREPESSRD